MKLSERKMEIALMGNPNVGKSTLFTKLTGVGVMISNYPGTTVEFKEGSFLRGGRKVAVHDLPGTYSLSGESEDEIVAIRMLAENRFDAVVVVVDATRLESSLVLLFQVIELGYPVLVALNQMDIAQKRYDIDLARLEGILGLPVFPVSAIVGEGVDELAQAVVSDRATRTGFKVSYDSHIEEHLESLAEGVPATQFPPRGAMLKLLEGNEYISSLYDEGTKQKAYLAAKEFRADHGESINIHITRDRYGEAGRIRKEAVTPRQGPLTMRDRISDMTMRPATGIPILIGVLAFIFLAIVIMGEWLEHELEDLFGMVVGDVLVDIGRSLAGDFGAAVGSGVTLGIEAIVVLIIPFVMVWYVILALLEDSGYMPRAVALLDGVMHKVGLHGRAVIPMLVGIGCSVPAILATRTAGSKRERLILSTLIVMAVPCGAQMAIIVGLVSRFVGIAAAAGIFVMLLALLLVLGFAMDRWLRREPTCLAMEIPDLRTPTARNVAFKTYSRSRDFFMIAFPFLLVGSVLVEILLSYDAMDFIVEPMSFITVGILGLPAVTIIAFVFGILRKELAVGMLVTISGVGAVGRLPEFMDPVQFVVFGVVMAIYMPCLAAWAVLMREVGVRNALLVGAASILTALLAGGAVNLVLRTLF